MVRVQYDDICLTIPAKKVENFLKKKKIGKNGKIKKHLDMRILSIFFFTNIS